MKKKHFLIGLCIGGLMMSCSNPQGGDNATNDQDSTAVADTIVTAEADTIQTAFGPEDVDTTNAISVEELVAQFDGQTKMKATFKGAINETCSKMGCWVNVKDGTGETFQVRFKDHFGIPTETEVGTIAYFSGEAVLDTISVDKQRHYLEDAEASQEEIDAITEPKVGMSFIADGVQLVKL